MATVSSFRLAFPEFGDAAKYPDPLVGTWLAVSAKLVNAARWAELTDFGIHLQTAHRLALATKANREAAAGKVPGGSQGLLSSKSVDGVSVSYDVSSATEEGAGHWNLTTYGTQYVQLARQMGVGPVYIGVEEGQSSVAAWPGPLLPPY